MKLTLRLAFFLAISLVTATACSDADDETPADDHQEVECGFTDGASPDCPSGKVCTYEHTADRESTDETFCHERCNSDDDCPEHRPNCTPDIEWGSSVCSEADFRPRTCDPQATDEDCECGVSDDNAFLVQGTGDDCEIIEEEITACFEQASTCLNDCVPEFYRYELDDGTAIIAMGLQGSISSGWEGDGQHTMSPSSCPAVEISDFGL